MLDAEQAPSPVSDDTVRDIISSYNVAVHSYSKLVRRLLQEYDGYECKEPEAGKFTLAFRSVTAFPCAALTLYVLVAQGCVSQNQLQSDSMLRA